MLTVTVSQLNRYLKAVLEEDQKLSGIFVKGEVSGYTRHYRSGHMYFTLRDENAAVRAVMFSRYADDLRFEPQNGMSVIAQGSVGVYERDGAYQLYVTDIQPDGAGALALAFEQTKARLAAQGRFEERYKKPLPLYPFRIGVATSETGAVLQDIRNVLERRYPLATLVFCPATVQGRDAPASLIRALCTLDERGSCDVIILARGGGSPEDLAAFNDEMLARAVFSAETPVVSAVGHETDYTICDFVADLRAPTPSAAAELCTPSVQQLLSHLTAYSNRLHGSAKLLLHRYRGHLNQLTQSRSLIMGKKLLEDKQERLDFLSEALYNKKCMFIQQYTQVLSQRAKLLNGLNPLKVLERGYCAAFCNEKAISTIEAVEPGQTLTLRFHDGVAETSVQTITRGDIDEEKRYI